ncbi:MAG: uracil phosphoribosyltransferase [Verrucomicrobiae bacterium]|nr:uracil phosphoribosyltransferase [Verrucomicrobiae bacterium]
MSEDLVQKRQNVTLVDHPLIRVKLTQLRDKETSPMEFRAILQQLAGLMLFEVTRSLETKSVMVETPLMMEAQGHTIGKPIVIVPILRAGLGLVDGMLWMLPEAKIGHIGMYRNEATLQPQHYYAKLPELKGATVLLLDPMLATGSSSVAAVSELKQHGAEAIIFVCLLSCKPGINRLQMAHPEIPIYTTAIDDGLNDKGYIYPGLGDAGDRYFGTI